MKYQILLGDAYEQLRKLKTNSVQCIVTSPPYWALRDYGVPGQLGQEQTPSEYVAKIVAIFSEAKRVLKDDGIMWLNLGDTYVGSSQGSKNVVISEIQKSNRGSLHAIDKTPVNHRVDGLKPKDLVGIPWSVALALRAAGWYLRMDVIWHKTNPMPESVSDRPTKAHEYIFLLTKNKKYFYDADAIREPMKEESFQRAKYKSDSPRYHKLIGNPQYPLRAPLNPLGRNKRSVWTISLKHNRVEHYASFPEDIPEICIKAGTKAGDVVLDPFAGSGTTLAVALKLKRKAVGIELNKKYVEKIIKPRLEKVLKAA